MRLKNYFKPENKTKVNKTAKILKKGVDANLFLIIAKEIKKSFDFNWENCTDWEITAKEQEDKLVIDFTCMANKRK